MAGGWEVIESIHPLLILNVRFGGYLRSSWVVGTAPVCSNKNVSIRKTKTDSE